MKKGIIQLIPAILISLLLALSSIGLVVSQRTQTLESQVLSSSDINHGPPQNYRQTKGVENQGSNRGQGNPHSTSTTNANSQSQGSNGKNDSKSSPKTTTNIQTNNQKTKNGTTGTTTEIENEGTQSATSSVRPGLKIRTNFPITVNPITGEKTVTTPGGVHVVILPEVAIANMIKAGFPVVLPPQPSPGPSSSPEGTPSASPGSSSTPEATTSSITTSESGVLLTELNNQLVYEIPAIQKKKFLGLLPVDIKITGYISAENGNLITTRKGIFDNILNLLSL